MLLLFLAEQRKQANWYMPYSCHIAAT
jgi:hypothetical protein